MKPRILVILVVCALAVLLGWYLAPSAPSTPAKTAEATPTAQPAAPKLTPAVAPVHNAAVAAPVVAAAVPTNTPTTSPAAADENFVAGPQADLKTCVAATIHFLQTQDVLGLVKTIMPPDAINQMIQSGQAGSIEDVAAHYQAMPDVPDKMNQLLQALQDVQDQEPELSTDGNTATYKIDNRITGPGKAPAAPGTPGDITFVKINGFWYLR